MSTCFIWCMYKVLFNVMHVQSTFQCKAVLGVSLILLNAHWAACRLWERENLKFRSMRSSYGWLVSNTVNDGLQRQIAHKIFKLKIEAHPVNAGHYMAFRHHISSATNLAANFGWDWSRTTPDIASKLLQAAIWSHCAILFESEQTPFSWTWRRFRSAALHRIQCGICGFVHICHIRDQWLMERLS